MNLDASLRATAIDLFNQGKRVNFQLNHVLAEFYRECRQREDLIDRFVEVQLQIATVDGTLTSKEDTLLWHICSQLRVSRFHYQRVKIQLLSQRYFYQQEARSSQGRSVSSLAEAYKILGLTPAATQAEVKRAYRRLMSQHHPDKLAAKGLSEATMVRATEKTQQISKAYQTIQKLGNV
jgi:DnaJ like chaperone protein